MCNTAFEPKLAIVATSKTPTPCLPINYEFFRYIRLPSDVTTLRAEDQLVTAGRAVRARGERHSYGPFGFLVGHRFQCSPCTTYFLNAVGEFAAWESRGPSLDARASHTDSYMPKHQHSKSLSYFVIGRAADEFVSLVPLVDGDEADDKNLDGAMKFSLLDEAVASACERGGSVFEVVQTGAEPALRELMVDLRLATSMPFDGCYKIGELIVGPSFVGDSINVTRERVEALAEAEVRVIVNLLDRRELFWMRRDIPRYDYQELFEHYYFPVADGDAPSREQMVQILDVLEESLAKGTKVYLHCHAGRGRSGCVAGCFLARTGVANGIGALNKLAEIRHAHGLFSQSPETGPQRRLVTKWSRGE